MNTTGTTDIETRIRTVVCQTFEISEDQCCEDLTAGDIPEWDSLGHLNLLVSIEKEFGLAFEVTDTVEIESVGDIIDIVTSYLESNR